MEERISSGLVIACGSMVNSLTAVKYTPESFYSLKRV